MNIPNSKVQTALCYYIVFIVEIMFFTSQQTDVFIVKVEERDFCNRV